MSRERGAAAMWDTAGGQLEVDGIQPVPATRDDPGHPHQLKLKAYLDEVAARVEPLADDNLFLDLTVDVEEPDRLLNEGDLKPYLAPLVQRLGESRFVLVRGHKTVGGGSRLRIGPAVSAAAPEGFSFFQYRTSSGGDDWQTRDRFRKALVAARLLPLPDGAAEIEIAWRCAAARNWVHLWKPTSDVLGPILGEHSAHEPFHPLEERVTDLSLHLLPDATLGPAVEVSLWWRPASDAPRAGRTLHEPLVPAPGGLEVPTLAHDLMRFSDNDAGYLRWLAQNATGYVLNIHRRLTSSSVHILHVATCPHISGSHEHYTTNEYVKLCSSRQQALLDWAEASRGLLRHCGTCL